MIGGSLRRRCAFREPVSGAPRYCLRLVPGLFILVGCSTADRARPTAVAPALTVAAVSMESRIRDVEGNLTRIEGWVRRAAAAGADLVLLPETAISGWWASREIRRYAEPLDGPSVRRLIRLAGKLGVVIAVGMTEKNGDRAHIAHVLLDGHGVIGVHRKTELAPGEEKYWDPGDDADVFDVRGVRIGIAICYESVHPRICARLRAAGAEVILAPYANGTDPDELLNGKRPYPYARARENRVWYVACDAPAHDEQGRPRRGAAYVIDPTGRLAAVTAHNAVGENMVVYPLAPRVAVEPTPRRQSWAARGVFPF